MILNINKIKEELSYCDYSSNIQKDILIVVHNQYDYIKNCIESIFDNTKNFNIYIWNNNSDDKTGKYLEKISKKNKNIELINSSENIGFVISNNKLAEISKSPYIILLNSDTEVRKYWDEVLVGYLEKNKEVGAIGYQGGILNSDGLGVGVNYGYDIDYICGWCLCFSRKIYEQFGLFDENIKFAYCEDSDFSLKLISNNKKIYACYSKDLVFHYGNVTSNSVMKKNDFSKIIKNNLIYLKSKWGEFPKASLQIGSFRV